MKEGAIAGLWARGLTNEEILEVAAISGYFNFINRFGYALGMRLDEEYVQMASETGRVARREA